MPWLENIIVRHSEVVDPQHLANWSITGTLSALPDHERSLLVAVEVTEDAHYQIAYTGLYALPCSMTDADHHAVVSLLPLDVLRPHEQHTLHAWLVARSWPAWARAPQQLRARLGAADAPIGLAQAAHETHIPLTTLQSAAANERLPTIRAADRHLVYIATVIEAQQRGLLGLGRGRPRRAR